MNTNPPNPYVGPRTFLKHEGHLFFGRDREARDLLALVNSEKLVLFYAQSGAGKSSLINTRLIPSLEAKKYEVLRVGRVGGEDSLGIDIDNIYVFNLMRSLIQRDIQPDMLAQLRLSEFLSRLQCSVDENDNEYFCDLTLSPNQGSGTTRRVLIVDQFEEIFSTHPEAWNKREDFFEQLAEVMENDSHLWIVLVMREDYIASLDPYAHLMPGGLRTRYYMQRLGREAAIEAVRKPVEKLRPYEEGVAEKLVDDLSSIKVQKPDGTQDLQPGQYVEAVQLQVVCYGLWQNLPPQGAHITEQDLLEIGDVDEALGKYYDGRVAEVAKNKRVKERLIRDWIEDKLIAPGGFRSMVLRDTSRKSGGIHDDVIQALQSDLVRAENRGGTIWYELTHDRLVNPILESNKKWFDENLSPLQRQATLWHDQERNESWLLRYEALAEVEQWAHQNPDELSELEIEFLEACREQQLRLKQKQQEQMLAARRMRTFLTMVTFLALVAGLAAIWAYSAGTQANQARNIAQQANTQSTNLLSTAQVAEADALSAASIAKTAQANAEASANQVLAGNLAAQADSLKNENYPLALLLGVEAYKRGAGNPQTSRTLFQLLQFTPYKQKPDFESPVSNLAISPDGTVIAAASNNKIVLYNADLKLMSNIAELTGVVYSLAFHQYAEDLILVAGGCVPEGEGCSENRGQLTIWKITNGRASLIRQAQAHGALVKTVAFSADGNLLATGSYDKTILLWKMPGSRIPVRLSEPLIGHFSFVNSLAFSPDGRTLISAGDDRNLFIWNISNPGRAQPLRSVPRAHEAPINMITFSPNGKQLASASDDNSVILWDWDSDQRTLQEGRQLKGHTGFVRSIAFQKNDEQIILASAGFDNQIILWDPETGKQFGPHLGVHSKAINAVAFGVRKSAGKAAPYLVSGSSDRSVILWDLSTRHPVSSTTESTDEFPEQLSDSNNAYRAISLGQRVDLQDSDQDEFLRLEGFDQPVEYVEIRGSNLITVYQDPFNRSWLSEWNINPQDWIRLACKAVGRNLTQKEWDQFLPKLRYEKTCE